MALNYNNDYGWLQSLLFVGHILNWLYVGVIAVFALLFVFESTGEANINKPEIMRWLMLAESIVLVIGLMIAIFLSYKLTEIPWRRYKFYIGLHFSFLIFQAITMAWVFVWHNNKAALFDSGIPILPGAYDMATIEAFNNYFAMMLVTFIIYAITFVVGAVLIWWMMMGGKSKAKTTGGGGGESQLSENRVGLMTKSKNRSRA